MIPIDDNQRAALITLLQRECNSLSDDLKEYQAMDDTERTEEIALEQADVEVAIENAQEMIDALTTGKWAVIDTEPACFAVGSDGKRCTGKGIYSPTILVHDPQGAPIAQTERQPALLVCEEHALDHLETYFPGEVWRAIQEQVGRQLNGLVVKKDDARLMFMNRQTGQLVPPPNRKILTR